MQTQHPAIARAAALKAYFYSHAHQAELSAPIRAEIELLDAQESDREYLEEVATDAAELRARIERLDAELSDPEFHFSLAQTSELEAERLELCESLDELQRHFDAAPCAPATRTPKFHYSNTAFCVAVVERESGGYAARRCANYRSCYVWRTGAPDAPVDESNDEDVNIDPFYDDGEPLYVAHCETPEMASALCTALNRDDSAFRAPTK